MKYQTFCAANSGDGFISLFDQLIDEKKKHIYFIKGGPGSGKSTLLKKIAEQNDEAELIICSGDPSSLDGVILPKQNVLLMDATAPHSYEPQYPGVGGSIVDLGQAWERDKLNKEKIIELCDQKKIEYQIAYSFLKSAKELYKAAFYPLGAFLDGEKCKKLVDKIFRQNGLSGKKEQTKSLEHRFISALSANGYVTLTDSILKLGKNIILIEDTWLQAHHFMETVLQMALENELYPIVAYHPLLGKNAIQHLIFPEADLSIISKSSVFPVTVPEDQIIKTISLHHLIQTDAIDKNRNKLSFLKRTEKELLQSGCDHLAAARDIHMVIEAEYRKGTNFKITEEIGQKLINKLSALS